MIKDLLKGKPVVVLGTLCILLFVLNIGSCINSYSQDSARKKEMAQRMDLEEKLSKFSQEKVSALDKLKAKEKELDAEKVSSEALNKALTQEQLVGQNLKEELQKVTRLKEALEDDLKAALAANKKAKMK